MDSGHNCEDTKQYSEEYDAYYCAECNVWLEDKCDDPECEFCPSRPEYPKDKKLIIILCEPRTGSNLLNEALNLYYPLRTINEFFLNLGSYIKEDFVPDDLPHKILLKTKEQTQLFDFLNVEPGDYPNLIKQITANPVNALIKLYEVTPVSLVVKIHKHQFEKLNLDVLLKLPYVEIIILQRSNRIARYTSLLKSIQTGIWHNSNTSDLKVVIDREKFVKEEKKSLDWYKKIRKNLRSKKYLEVNYERDLENINKESFYRLFDPWFEKIKLPVSKTSYELKYFKKQNLLPIEQSILNYDEITHLVNDTNG